MPQKAWSAKRERQYAHVKESLLEQGKPKPLAEEIAARVVNNSLRMWTSSMVAGSIALH